MTFLSDVFHRWFFYTLRAPYISLRRSTSVVSSPRMHFIFLQDMLINVVGKNAYSPQGYLAQDAERYRDYHESEEEILVRRYLIPFIAFLAGSSLIAAIYFGILILAQGWVSAVDIFLPNRWYVITIWISFGIQAALYSVLRFRLFVPVTSRAHTGTVVGTSGGTSVTAMVACCLHHVTDVLPVLALSAAATFLIRYQRPFMLASLGVNVIGILVMLVILYRERKKLQPVQNLQPALEIE